MAKESISEKLTELFDLFKSGALSKDEYDQLKSEIISNAAIQQPKETESLINSPNKMEEANETFSEKKQISEPSSISVTDKQPQNSDKKSDNNNLEQKPKKNTTIKIGITAAFLLILSVAAYFIITSKNAKNIWDEAAATKIITEELKKHSWDNAVTEASKINHRIVGFESMSLTGKDIMIALVLTNDNNSEPGGVPSLFEFNNQNGWKLVKKQVGFGEFMEKVNLFKIAPDNYCIFTSRSEAGAGQSWEHKVLYFFINNEFKEIFDTPYDFKFIPKSSGYCDIEVTPSGGNAEIYEFNGKEYVKTNNEKSYKNQNSIGNSSNYKENIVDLIKAYYYDFNNNTINFDASKFFADNVERYITFRNTTSEAISKYMQTDFIKEFINPNFGFELESFSVTQQEDNYVAEYIESSNCFRKSRQKNQKVRVHVKAIFNNNFKITYFSEYDVIENIFY